MQDARSSNIRTSLEIHSPGCECSAICGLGDSTDNIPSSASEACFRLGYESDNSESVWTSHLVQLRMAVIESRIQVERGALRKLKAHTKSRKGCGNCKFRKVKARGATIFFISLY